MKTCLFCWWNYANKNISMMHWNYYIICLYCIFGCLAERQSQQSCISPHEVGKFRLLLMWRDKCAVSPHSKCQSCSLQYNIIASLVWLRKCDITTVLLLPVVCYCTVPNMINMDCTSIWSDNWYPTILALLTAGKIKKTFTATSGRCLSDVSDTFFAGTKYNVFAAGKTLNYRLFD